MGSFSKLLGPSLQIGWILGPASAITILSRLKEAADLDVSTLSQWIANEYLRSQNFASHLTSLRSKYLSKRDVIHASLQTSMPDEVKWEIPSSGVFFWLSLPNQVNASTLLSAAIQEEGVSFLPAGAFSRNRRSDGLRLNFSAVQHERIEEGVTKIGKLLKRFICTGKSLSEHD